MFEKNLTLCFPYLSQNGNGIRKVGWESEIRYMGCLEIKQVDREHVNRRELMIKIKKHIMIKILT